MTENKPTVKESSGQSFGSRSMMPPEKPKEFKKTLYRLVKYLKPRRNSLIFVAIAAVFSTLFNVISPKLLGDATSSIFESFISGVGVDFGFIGQLLLALMVLYVLSAIFYSYSSI